MPSPGHSRLPNNSVRITYVTESFTPQINGAALSAERTLRHLRAAGHQVELLRPQQAGEAACDSPDEWRTGGGRLPLHSGLHFGHASMAALRRRWHASGQLPELVHVATSGPLAWSALVAARALGIATSADVRFNPQAPIPQSGTRWGAPLVRGYLKRLHGMADCCFVPTRDMAGQLTSQGYDNLQVLGRGVDVTAFSPQWRDCWLRRDWRACQHNPVLLYVGRLSTDKNVRLALQTYERLRQDERGLRMVVVGDGPLRRQLQAEHPRVRFAGWQRGTELARHYASADLCLLPNLNQSFGSVTLEALASGLALVAFDTAAAGVHVVDGINGFLAKPGLGATSGQDTFFAAAQRALAASAPDHPLRLQARLAALRADWHGVLGGFEARLRQLANQVSALHPAQAALA